MKKALVSSRPDPFLIEKIPGIQTNKADDLKYTIAGFQ